MGRESSSKIVSIISHINQIPHNRDGLACFYLGGNYLTFQKLEKLGFQSLSQYRSDSFAKTGDFKLNIDTYFKDDLLLTLTNTCTFNQYLTRICELVVQGKIVFDLMKAHENIVLFVDTEEDVHLYQKFVKANGGSCVSLPNKLTWPLRLLKAIRNNTIEVFDTVKNIFYLKNKRKFHNTKSLPSVYLISWVDGRSFTQGDFWIQNRYFGFLPEFLKKNVPFQIVGRVMSGVLDYKETINNGLNQDHEISFIEDYLSIWDPICAFFHALKLFKYTKKEYKWGGINFSPFVKECLISDYVSGRYLNSLINFYAFQKMLKKIPQQSIIIYPFENQPWERALNLAKRMADKNIRCLAYQFFPIPKRFLIHRFSNLQVALKLTPEAILTSDKCTEKLFHEQHITTIPIGNFRYEFLRGPKPSLGKNFNKNNILCCPSFDSMEAIELSSKAIEATKGLCCNLWINFHSLLSMDTKVEILEMAEKNSHVLVRDLPLSQLISDVSIVLYQSSSVAYEAVLQGIPALYVESDLKIDLNRFYGCMKTFAKPEDGRLITQNLLQDEAIYTNYSQKLYKDAMGNIIHVNKEELEKLIQ